MEFILVGDALAERVRAAFDAYIFLSYRKIDYAKAKDLTFTLICNSFAEQMMKKFYIVFTINRRGQSGHQSSSAKFLPLRYKYLFPFLRGSPFPSTCSLSDLR